MAPESPHHSFDAKWLAELRQRFAEITARRVPETAVEDLVQDAISIILAKGPDEARRCGLAEPPLPWSFNVLRNVIGNYYQKRRSHDSLDGVDLPDDRPDALASLTQGERNATIGEAVADLKAEKPDCAHWLWSVAEGTKPGHLAREAGLEEAAFYRRLYRCRQALATILKRRGLAP